MVIIETQRALKECAIAMLTLLLQTLALPYMSIKPEFASIFEISLLFYASYAGWSIFDRERQENAFEFALSLPISRTHLLLIKILPRAACATIVFLFYVFLHRHFTLPSFLSVSSLLILYVSFFLISLSFSISTGNYFVALSVTCFLSIGMFQFIRLFDINLPEKTLILHANLPLFLLPIIFFIVFQRFDIKPIRYFNIKFVPAVVLVVIISGAALYHIHYIRWRCHFITSTGDIVRVNCSSCKATEWIHDETIKRYKGCIHLLKEVGDSCFYVEKTIPDSEGHSRELALMDFASGKSSRIFALGNDYLVIQGKHPDIQNYTGKRAYFLLFNNDTRQYYILTVEGKNIINNVHVTGDIIKDAKFTLFHVCENPVQFLLFDQVGLMIYRVSYPGELTVLAKADTYTAWKNRLLLLTHSSVTLYEMNPEPRVIYQLDGNIKIVRQKWGHDVHRHLPFLLDRTSYLFDLEKDAPEKLDVSLSGFYYIELAGKILFVKMKNSAEWHTWQLENGKLIQLVKEPIVISASTSVISKAGILFFDNKKHEIHPLFPGGKNKPKQ